MVDSEYIQHDLFLQDISKFSDKNKLYYWLYSPNETLALNKLVLLCRKDNIPNIIVIYKIVQYMLSQETSTDEIIIYLVSNNFINNCDSPKVQEIIKFFESTHLIKYYDHNTMDKIYQITSSEPDLIARHDGYPIPDPIKGRPHIGWLTCRHARCNLVFPNSDMLINHLKGYNKYIPYMHQYHESIVYKMDLTANKIINNKITKCPSYACSEANHIFTPEELCEHFKLLGIKPFWPSYEITNSTNLTNSTNTNNTTNVINYVTNPQLLLNKIYTTENCIVCLDKSPQLVLYPCLHHVFCFNCINLKIYSRCSICRQKIIDIFPF